MTVEEQVELVADLLISNGYTLTDEVRVVYTYDNVVKRRKMSLIDSLGKLQLKLERGPRTIGVDFKIIKL